MRALALSSAVILGLCLPAAADSIGLVQIGAMIEQGLAASAKASDDGAAQRSASQDVMRRLGLPDAAPVTADVVAPPAFPGGRGAEVKSGALQVALTQLAIYAGANGQLPLVQAQNGLQDAIFLRSGHSTLAEVGEAARAAGIEGLRREGGVWHLSRPMVLWADAGLRLEPGDVLEMDRGTGAFLLGFGRLDLAGAVIRRVGAQNAAAATYAPFLLIAGQGSLLAEHTRFEGLGYGPNEVFGGVAVYSRSLFQPSFPPVLTNNVFNDVGSVALFGADGALLRNNRISAARIGGVSLIGGSDNLLLDNVFVDSRSGAAIRLSNSLRARISGNVVTAGRQNGILIEDNSRDALVSANVLVGNGGAGLAVYRTDCSTITGNLIARNGAAGLRLRSTGSFLLAQNAFVMNRSAGVDLQGQKAQSGAALIGNYFAGNREGLRGTSLGEIRMDGNRLEAQVPRMFGGEFSQHLSGFLTALQREDATEFRIVATGREAMAPAPSALLSPDQACILE